LKPNGQEGTELTLRAIDADISLAGQFAYAKQTLIFHNTISDRIEADFIYTLPQNTQITSFAYWYGAERVPARIYEKQEAAAIYQHITSRKRDPALIEMIDKSTFRARIFPVMPNADLKVEMTLVQTLHASPGSVAFTLPIQDSGNPLDSARVRVQVKDVASTAQVRNNFGLKETRSGSLVTMRLARTNFQPEHNLTIRVDRPRQAMTVSVYSGMVRGEGYFAGAITSARAVIRPRLFLSGGGISDLIIDSPSRLRAGETLLITGRYRTGGTHTVTLTDASRSHTETAQLALSNHAATGDVAMDLWASRWMEKLSRSEGNENRVIALSRRYRLPSRYTSWLAVPKSEMQWYQLEMSLTAYANQVRQAGVKAPGSRRLEAKIERISRQMPALSERDQLSMAEALNQAFANVVVEDAAAGKIQESRQLYRTFKELSHRLTPAQNWDEVSSNVQGLAENATSELFEAYGRPNVSQRQITTLKLKIANLLALTNSGQSLHDFLSERHQGWVDRNPEAQALRESLRSEYAQVKPNAVKIADLKARYKRQFATPFDNSQSRHVAQARLDWTEVSGKHQRLEQMDVSNPRRQVQVAAATRELDRRISELRARYGDPLIRIAAPEDAQHVTALMPDGEIKPLVWDAASHCWQARFDIPRYATPGDYTITIIIVTHEGIRRTVAIHYHVDLTPPSGLAHSTTDQGAHAHLEITASDNTARVKAILPWNTVVELQQAGANLFRADIPVPESFRSGSYAVTYVLTDQAHNRTVMQIDMAAK
jgi:hypothetical protein